MNDSMPPGGGRTPSAQDLSEARALLSAAPVAFLAVTDEGPDAGPYLVPINFAYDDAGGWERIIIHTGEGRKSRALEVDPRVCLAVVADAAFELGEEPCDDGFLYRSVVVEGRALRLEAAEEREAALRAMVLKYDPEAGARPFAEETLARTLVYAIEIESITYKQRPKRHQTTSA